MGKSVYEKFGTSLIAGSDQTQQRHIVAGGETLPLIASDRYQTEYDSELWRQTAEANSIDDPDAIVPGQALIIPTPLPTS